MAATVVPDVRHVTSADGTRIGYLTTGRGPAVVVLHGAMQTAGSQRELADALADRFRVVLPDRRGRGSSAPRPPVTDPAAEVSRDVEDVAAVVRATGAQVLVGVSSGAVLALLAARAVPAVRAVVAFEPPLLADPARAATVLARLERELAAGRPTAALTTGWLAIELGPAWVRRLPRRVLEVFVGLGSRAEARRAADPTTTMRALAATLPHDFRLVAAASADPEVFAEVAVPVLLVGTGRSPAYLRRALDTLAAVLPDARRVTLPGVGHEVTGNRDRRGRPDVVAAAVAGFLAAGHPPER